MRLATAAAVGLMGTAILAVTTGLLPAQTLPVQSLRVAADSPPAARATICVAVLGQVERPGTYRLERGEVGELLTAAGGFTDGSSRNVRIIRDGRGGQKTFVEVRRGTAIAPVSGPDSQSYAAGGSTRLKPGDVVIAEGSRTGKAGGLGRTASGAIVVGRANDRAAPRKLTVAILGVQPWPVVWSLVPEDNSVQALLRNLNQPARGKVTLTSSSGVAESFELADSAVKLIDGTVVTLPPGAVERSMLPRLPEPTPVGVAALPPETSALSAKTPAESPNPLPPPGEVAELMPSPSSPTEMPVRVPIEPRAETAAVPSLPSDTEPPSTPLDQAPEPTPAVPEAPARADGSVPEPKERAVTAGSSSLRDLPVPLVFIGASALFLAILTALTWNAKSKPTAVESASFVAAARPAEAAPDLEVPVAAPPREATELPILEWLVANQLPITEERVVFPADVRLIGRPVEQAPVRTDAAHPVPDPHIPVQPVAQKPAAVSAAAPQVRIDRSHPARKGLLDRALAAVEREAARK